MAPDPCRYTTQQPQAIHVLDQESTAELPLVSAGNRESAIAAPSATGNRTSPAAMEGSVEYRYRCSAPTWANAYLWPPLRRRIETRFAARNGLRALDLGCGNGATSGMLAGMGFSVTGLDTSASGIAIARRNHPACRFELASAYDDLAGAFGRFPVVVCLEVVEHLYDPRLFARRLFDALEPGGIAMISTPYHGYWKNLALALSGRMDAHFTALWDGGHIKFWSPATLGRLLGEAGFAVEEVARIGRVRPLAKSMLVVARRPAAAASG